MCVCECVCVCGRVCVWAGGWVGGSTATSLRNHVEVGFPSWCFYFDIVVVVYSSKEALLKFILLLNEACWTWEATWQ